MSSNVFILTADSLSYPHFTDQAAALAEQVDGVNFTTAIAPANETGASMPALATGTYEDAISGSGLPDQGDPQPLLEILSENGYDTGLWTDNFLFGESYNYDRGVGNGDQGEPSTKKEISKWIQGSALGSFFHWFEWAYFNVVQPVADRAGGYSPFYRSAETIHTDVLEWLDGSTGDSPVACWIHYMDTHHPFEPPSEYLEGSAFTEDRSRSELAELSRDLIKDDGVGYSDDEFADVEAVYRASCRYLSDSVSAFVDDLKRHGHFDPSEDVLVFSSDHGESLRRDRETVGHTPVTFWDDIVRVPLVVSRPDWQFETITQQVSLVDLVPTVLDAFDLPVPDDIDGRVTDSPSGLAREVALSISQKGTPEGVRNYRCARTADGYKLFGCHEGTIRQTHAGETGGEETATATFEAWDAVDRAALAEDHVPSYDALDERGGAIEDRHTSEEVGVPEEHLRNLGYKS